MTGRKVATRLAIVGGTTVAGAVLALAPALPAHASNCKITTEGYSHHKVSVCGTNYNRHPTTTVVTHEGDGVQLPFTGADVIGMGIVGLGLIGGGTALVVAGRRRRSGAAAA